MSSYSPAPGLWPSLRPILPLPLNLNLNLNLTETNPNSNSNPNITATRTLTRTQFLSPTLGLILIGVGNNPDPLGLVPNSNSDHLFIPPVLVCNSNSDRGTSRSYQTGRASWAIKL